jgi:hypothetical protein
MLSFTTIIRATVLLGVLALLNACAINAPVSMKFTAHLIGAKEVPPTVSNGSGILHATLNTDTNVLSWTVKYSGLTGPVTAAHFHGPAQPGQSAAPVIPLTGNLSRVINGKAILNLEQRADLLDGKLYLNLHTAAYPNGEIRGQVTRETVSSPAVQQNHY